MFFFFLENCSLGLHGICSMSATDQYQLIWQVIFHSVRSSALWRGVKTRPVTDKFEFSKTALTDKHGCSHGRSQTSTIATFWSSAELIAISLFIGILAARFTMAGGGRYRGRKRERKSTDPCGHTTATHDRKEPIYPPTTL